MGQTLIRVWAAGLIGGSPGCVVRDVEHAIVGGEDVPGKYRPYCYVSLDENGEVEDDEVCAVCRPDNVCKKCHAVAAKYWRTAHERDRQRHWRAILTDPEPPLAPRYGAFCATIEEAEADARTCGVARIACLNGYLKLIGTRDVPPETSASTEEDTKAAEVAGRILTRVQLEECLAHYHPHGVSSFKKEAILASDAALRAALAAAETQREEILHILGTAGVVARGDVLAGIRALVALAGPAATLAAVRARGAS